MDEKLINLQDNLEGLWNQMYNLVDDFASENLNSVEDADKQLKYIFIDELPIRFHNDNLIESGIEKWKEFFLQENQYVFIEIYQIKEITYN